jgi:hypothetical protein
VRSSTPRVADDQVDPDTARDPQHLERVVRDQDTVRGVPQRLLDQVLGGGVLFEDDDRGRRSVIRLPIVAPGEPGGIDPNGLVYCMPNRVVSAQPAHRLEAPDMSATPLPLTTLEAILGALPVAAYTNDLHGFVTWINDAAKFGRRRSRREALLGGGAPRRASPRGRPGLP